MKMKWFKMFLILFLLCSLGRLAHATPFPHYAWDDDSVVGQTIDIQFLLDGENIDEGLRFSPFADLIAPTEDALLPASLSMKDYAIGTDRPATERTFSSVFNDSFPGRSGCDLPASPHVPTNPVPEPATMLLFGAGAIVIGTVVKRKKTKIKHIC